MSLNILGSMPDNVFVELMVNGMKRLPMAVNGEAPFNGGGHLDIGFREGFKNDLSDFQMLTLSILCRDLP